MENEALMPDTLASLEEIILEAGLPKSVIDRSDFLPSLILGTPEADSLSGTADRDYIFGFAGDDELLGLGGNDFLFSGPGNNTIRGGEGRDRIYGDSGQDNLFGDAGDDRFRDTSGGNNIDGGEGRDTVNYRNISGPIDFRFDVETTEISSDPREILAEGRLQIAQEGLEPDNISSIERVIAPEDKDNSIDFRENFFRGRFGPDGTAAVIAPSINVDLEEELLRFDESAIAVENFQTVFGSINDDVIKGDDQNNRLEGFGGVDVVEGRGGNDLLSTFEEDTLVGGIGSDTFELKGLSKIQGSNQPTVGFVSASTIADFEPGVDRIQLSRDRESFGSGIASEITVYIGFTELSAGSLDADQFAVLGSGSTPTGPGFLYDNATGDLFYRDGNLSDAGARRRIATLQGAPDISASDIFVV